MPRRPKPENARQIAAAALVQVDETDAYAKLVLQNLFDELNVAKQERAFATELVYGCLRNRGYVDWILSQFVKRPLEKVEPAVLNILRIGVYQLVFIDGVPVHAVCNEAVENAKKIGHQGTASFVNGVLRNVSRGLGGLRPPSLEEDPVSHIVVVYSHPEWMVRRWLNRYGVLDTVKLCRMNNRIPETTIRTNSLKTDPASLRHELETQGILVSPSEFLESSFRIKSYESIDQIQAYRDGHFLIQDETSTMAGLVVSPKSSQFVIDACSAPGGKTTHLAELMNNEGTIVASDIHSGRLGLVRDNARRLGITIIKTETLDARLLPEKYALQADALLLDVPCSGLGVLHKRPDARWRKKESDIDELSLLQYELLSKVSQCVKIGGSLVYSTCTIEPEENEKIVKRFLTEQISFAPDSLDNYLPDELCRRLGICEDRWYMQFLPHEHNMDGFFIARMIRIS